MSTQEVTRIETIDARPSWINWLRGNASRTPKEVAIKLDGKHRQAHRSGPQHSVRFGFTREGFHFVFLVAFVLVGAIIRNVNLLVVLGGILIGMLFFQWRLCTRTLHHLSLIRKVPSHSQARRPFRITLQLRNHKKWLGAWTVMVQDRLMEIDRDNRPLSDGYRISTVVERAPPLSTSVVEYECTCERRGLVEFGPIQLSTIFPWGLLRSYYKISESDQCVVHPTLGNLKPGWRELFDVRRYGSQQTRAQSGSSEGEFFGLRNYRVGDSPRWIHWRTTARRNEPVVRQFERQENIHACILLDLYRPPEFQDKEALSAHEELVDEAVEFVSTLANTLVGRGGGTISVAIAADTVSYAEKIQSRNQVLALLDELAIVQSSKLADWRQGVQSLSNTLRSHPLMIVVSTRPEEWSQRAIRSNDPTEWVLQRVQVRWLDVSQGALERHFSRTMK